jgi:pimeloyl-ACP methyl ester carboxylesterase
MLQHSATETPLVDRMTDTFTASDGHSIAFDRVTGAAPEVVFLHGLASDRGGTKALALEAHCRERGLGFTRFDMFGHGQSSGRFEDGGPSRWTADALSVIDQLTRGPVILIGSSMGGWVALKAAMARPTRIAGLIGIAAAPDFTEDLMWPALSPDQRATITRGGLVELPGDYGNPPLRIARHLIEDGCANLILRAPIDFSGPVRLMHGQKDASVPWRTALAIAERLSSANVEITLLKDGDHRLSRPADLTLLCDTLDRLVATCSLP